MKITYRRSQRAKNLRITIAPTQAVTVTVPACLSLERAKEFVKTKQAWIQKHLLKIQEAEQRQQVLPELSPEQLNTAQAELVSRLERFSEKYGLFYSKVGFRCQKTRWGSCSGHDNISLNINLVFLPTHLQDYVLLHELCHIRHKNHSKNFWSRLDRYCHGRAKLLAKELKTYQMKITK